MQLRIQISDENLLVPVIEDIKAATKAESIIFSSGDIEVTDDVKIGIELGEAEK